MTDLKILTAAIQKAIDGGWQPYPDIPELEVYPEFYEPSWSINFKRYVNSEDRGIFEQRDLFTVIFDHGFARALWPNPPVIPNKPDASGVYPVKDWPFKFEWWQWQLMQMVLADDPIAYLGEHI